MTGAGGAGLFGLLDMDFEDAVGVVRPGLAVAGTLRQSDRARELSEGALVAEEAPILHLGVLTRAADRQGAVLEVDGDRLLRYAGESNACTSSPSVSQTSSGGAHAWVGESGGTSGRFEDGLDQPIELAIHGDVPFLSDCDLWSDRRSSLVRAFCPVRPW
jgi:hypothetical protein